MASSKYTCRTCSNSYPFLFNLRLGNHYIYRSTSTETKKTLLTGTSCGGHLKVLRQGVFIFMFSNKNSVYNVCTCMSQYETQGEIALVSSTSISPLHRAQRQDQLRDNNMAAKASESTFMLKVIFVPRVVKTLSGQRRRRQDSVHNKPLYLLPTWSFTKYAIIVVSQF